MIRQEKAFTLIELLVVISIIAILLAILVPSLGKAKLTAQEVICKTNLKQYYLVTELYCNDHDQMYPSAWTSIYKGSSSGCVWHDETKSLEKYPENGGPYWPYLQSKEISICPTFANLASKKHQCSKPIDVQFSYSMNGFITGRGRGVKKTSIKSNPSQTFLWSEENMWRLKDKDGKILSNYVLNDNALLVGENGGIDCFGSFHKISIAKHAAQMPMGGSNHGVYDSGSANVVLMDGSIISATPLDSVKYRGKI